MVKLLQNEEVVPSKSWIDDSSSMNWRDSSRVEAIMDLSFLRKRDVGTTRIGLTLDSYKPDMPVKSTIDDFSDMKTKETFPLIIRATDGDKFKISTMVTQEGLEEFFGKYGDVCKNGMQGLKKRDRKKEKAKKEKKEKKK